MTTTYEAVREDILDTVKKLKAGQMDATMGLAVAANYKVYNDNVFAQVASAKLVLQIGGKGNAIDASQQRLERPKPK